jgi:ankyrin repeat protein
VICVHLVGIHSYSTVTYLSPLILSSSFSTLAYPLQYCTVEIETSFNSKLLRFNSRTLSFEPWFNSFFSNAAHFGSRMVGNSTIEFKYEYGIALQAAAWVEHLDVVKLLLDQGADVNVQGGEYGTALQAAALGGYLDVIKLLLDQGADVNVQGDRYGTALQAAAWGEHLDVVKLLLDQGADVNVQGGRCGTALQAAAWGEHLDVVKLLLDQGATFGIPIVDSQGASLLHSAIACEDTKKLSLLLETGAHFYIDKADVFKQTPLHIAASHFPAAFKILENSLNPAAKNGNVDAWALMHNSINKEDIDGCTALHLAVENRALGAAEWLINHGADVDIENFNKITPFQRASQLKDFRMMSYLFPHVTQGFINATDWRAWVPSRTKRNIILASGGPEISPVQIKDDQELTQHFNAMSYSLAFSTSSVSA